MVLDSVAGTVRKEETDIITASNTHIARFANTHTARFALIALSSRAECLSERFAIFDWTLSRPARNTCCIDSFNSE